MTRPSHDRTRAAARALVSLLAVTLVSLGRPVANIHPGLLVASAVLAADLKV